jgi:membrane protein DedA with SNARE-associated domain
VWYGPSHSWSPVSDARYPVFLLLNTLGSFGCGVDLVLCGHFLGKIAVVSDHLELMIRAIALLSTSRPWSRRHGRS